MGEYRIDTLFDLGKLEKEVENVIGVISKRLKTLQSFRVNLDGSRTIKEYADAVKLISAEQAALAKETAKLNAEEKQNQRANSETARIAKQRTIELMRARKESERSAEQDKKIAQQAANEYFNLNKALQDAELRYKNLALTQGFSNKQTQIALKEALAIRNVLDKVDQNLRNYQRNVGNYSSAFNGLGNSLQQILREAPSAANSLNTFFLAISNNLPILFDEIGKVKEANKAAAAAAKEASIVAKEQATAEALAAGASKKMAAAEGERAAQTVLANAATTKAPSVLQQMGKSLFSVQTLLTLSVLGFTLYGAKITQFIGGLFKSKSALSDFAAQQKQVAELQLKSAAEFAQSATQVFIYKEKLNDLNISQKDRIIFAKQYNEIADKGNQIDLTQINNLSKVNSQIEKQIALLKERALVKAAENLLSEKAEALLKAQIELNQKEASLPSINTEALEKNLSQAQAAIDKARKGTALQKLDAKEALSFVDLPQDLLNDAIRNNQKLLVLQDAELVKYLQGVANRVKLINDARAGLRAGTGGLGLLAAQDAERKAKEDFDKTVKLVSGLVTISTFATDKKDKAEKERKIADDTAEVMLREEYERLKIALERSRENNRKIFEDEKEIYEFRILALRRFTVDQIALIDAEREYAIAAEKMRLAKVIQGLEEEKKAKGAKIKDINAQEAREIKASESIIETIKVRAADKLLEIGADLNSGLQKLADERDEQRKKEQEEMRKNFEWRLAKSKEAFEKEKENMRKIEEDILEGRRNLYKELRELLFQFLADSITREEQYLDEQQRLIDENLRRRTNQINMLGLAESERVRQTAIAEKNAQAQTEQIEKRKRQLAVERAKFEKAASIASIIQNTAEGITKAFADGNPVLAGIVAAIGAVQLAKAISTPLPRYKEGRGKGKDELAITGDGGVPEYIIREEGHIEKTPARPTLTHLRAGDMVMKDGRELVRHMIEAANPWHQIRNKMFPEEVRQIQADFDKGSGRIVSAIEKNRPYIKIVNATPIESQAWWIKAFKE